MSGREPMPDCMLIAVGYGLDGKSLVFTDLMTGVWGGAFGACPGTMLQVQREFQQQGHGFIDQAWLTFDECNRELGVEEATFKMFTGGLLMPLRKNHEALWVDRKTQRNLRSSEGHLIEAFSVALLQCGRVLHPPVTGVLWPRFPSALPICADGPQLGRDPLRLVPEARQGVVYERRRRSAHTHCLRNVACQTVQVFFRGGLFFLLAAAHDLQVSLVRSLFVCSNARHDAVVSLAWDAGIVLSSLCHSQLHPLS